VKSPQNTNFGEICQLFYFLKKNCHIIFTFIVMFVFVIFHPQKRIVFNGTCIETFITWPWMVEYQWVGFEFTLVKSHLIIRHEKTNWPHALKVESNVECITQRSIKDGIVKRPTKSESQHVKYILAWWLGDWLDGWTSIHTIPLWKTHLLYCLEVDKEDPSMPQVKIQM
jgi:hypothetical protein